MTNELSDLGNLPSDIKEDGDFLGGYNPFESNVYDFSVTLAYISTAQSGAKCMNITVKSSDDRELKAQFWMTSGTAKGCLPYYTNQKTGEKKYLPGYTIARHLALLATGKELNTLVVEKKHIKLYNKEQKAEVPTEVSMCTELLNKPIKAAVIKRLVDKTKDSGTVDTEGKKVYTATGEVRTENEIVKLFHARDKRTVTEIIAKAEKAEFHDKWLAKWLGETEDKTSKNTGVSGLPGAAPAMNNTPVNAEVSNLFN